MLEDSDEEASALQRFATNLTQVARTHRQDPFLGRQNEMRNVIQVLSRWSGNNILVTGESGSGKTSMLRGIAEALAQGEVFGNLRDRELYSIDPRALVADLVSDESVAQRLNALANDLRRRPGLILAIDPMDAILETPLIDESVGVAGFMEAIMTNPEIRIIGMATSEEIEDAIKAAPAISAQFQFYRLLPPSVPETVNILKSVRDQYEAHHGVAISDDALVTAAELADEFALSKVLPGSALDLVDTAAARIQTRQPRVPEIDHLQVEIDKIRGLKEDAVEKHDFETAGDLRDQEKSLLTQLVELKAGLASGDHLHEEVDGKHVLTIASELTGLSEARVQSRLDARATVGPSIPHPKKSEPEHHYSLLNDLPATTLEADLLNSVEIAERIGVILEQSRQNSPLVIALDGGWGTGKSTLLRQVESQFERSAEIHTLRYNAWTARGDNALEGLIKSVLVELDPRLVRRWIRKAAQSEHVNFITRLVVTIGANLLGLRKLVDEFWSRTGLSAEARNRLKTYISGLLSQWVSETPAGTSRRALVVFVDDLDRCSDETIVEVCEAVKLYLDAPGLIFVLACDLSTVARGVSGAARGEAGEGRAYLEKIVQVAFRVPVPEEPDLRRLIEGYAKESGTQELVNDLVFRILIEQTGRNPRRIKKVLNSFVVESELNPNWMEPPLGASHLITASILQHLYPGFFDLLVAKSEGSDVVGYFLDYVAVIDRAGSPPSSSDAWWAILGRVLRRYQVAIPRRQGGVPLTAELAALDDAIPAAFLPLARDNEFISLMRSIGNPETRQRFISQLGRARSGETVLQ